MRALFRYLLALAALLAIWQIGSLALGEFLLPRPLDVLAYFGEALTTGAFWQHAGASAQGLDKKYLDSFRSLGGTPLQMLRHVLIPAALPDAMTALKVASGTAVAVLFMAESFATRRGLGFLIMDAWGRGDQLEMFTGILAMSLLGVALYELCNVLETRSCRWRNFHMAGKR